MSQETKPLIKVVKKSCFPNKEAKELINSIYQKEYRGIIPLYSLEIELKEGKYILIPQYDGTIIYERVN